MDNQKLRPKFHIHADGWINDPNGLVVFNGKYHAFFQYYPDDVKWGPMHWGHVVSEDLFNWQKQPVALTPDTDYDRDGCFSGSAIVWEGKLWLLYTVTPKTARIRAPKDKCSALQAVRTAFTS